MAISRQRVYGRGTRHLPNAFESIGRHQLDDRSGL